MRGPVRSSRALYEFALVAAGCCGLVPSSAYAQTPVAAIRADDEALGDIVVTARRREEPLQRTPVSVIALSAKDLEDRSVTNLRTLQNFVPNLTFAPSQFVGEGSTNIFIRGIGQEDYAASAGSASASMWTGSTLRGRPAR